MKPLREIQWDDSLCIYTNGHLDPAEFLDAVRAMQHSDVLYEDRAALTVEHVEHVRFRPLSPYEARSIGCDWGVMRTDVGGYPVTAVVL
jgi:hypothetical protein